MGPDRGGLGLSGNLRGAGFSGVGEAIAGALIVVGVIAGLGLGHGAVMLMLALGTCAATAAAGRWPYLATVLATLLLVLTHTAAVRGGLTAEVEVVYLTAFLIVEAIATTGNKLWIAGTAVVHGSLWLSTLTVDPLNPRAALVELVVTGMVFATSAGFGLLRYHWRHDKDSFAERQAADLEQMRRDIARDLHDSIAHDITAIVLRAGQAQTTDVSAEVSAQLEQIILTGQRSVHELRTMLAMLRLEGATESVWRPRRPSVELDHSRDRLRTAGFVPDIRTLGDLESLPHLVDDAVSKCLHECVSNVIKHGAKDSTCTIRLEVDDSVSLMVLNRIGPRSKSIPQGGLGLVGICERVESAGGAVDVGPQGNGLWAIHLSIPLITRGVL